MPGFVFLGESLVVDLLNTVVAVDGRPVDLLAGWAELVAWSDAAGVVRRDDWSSQIPGEPAAFRRYREILRRGLGTWARAGRATPSLLRALNRGLAGNPGRAVVRLESGRVKLDWVSTGSPRGRLYSAVARSAAELLATGERQRLRRCACPECVLRFYDVSKAGRRRWCSMQTCGARAKVSAFYARRAGAQRRRVNPSSTTRY